MRIKLAVLVVCCCLLGCGGSSNQPAEAPKEPVLENPHGANTSGPPDLTVLGERHKQKK